MNKTKQGETTPTNEIAVVREKVKGMQAMIDASPVTNDAELAAVTDHIRNIKALAKIIKEKKDKFVAPAKAIVLEAKAAFDPLLKECEDAEAILKGRASKYMLAVEDERRKEEAKIAARVEKGTLRPETAIKKMEALPDTPKTVRTDTGSGLRMSKRKVARITDPSLIPDEFWVVDEVRVRREALEREKYGKEPIPGVLIEEVADLSSV